ncbi:hypothetical protein [Cyanobium sp. L1E-Cus]|uniref:hypothetical protein n=1 Tax=Cyanobium sp. L1E-Cus TaxID=2823714 RepID=UPI0020CCD13F|nr:hypothetical protein [Cyanobium sp. L1E-Cus]MCP9821962.1 hypothetical protein [Cyanobium sp. L1E-Cus]
MAAIGRRDRGGGGSGIAADAAAPTVKSWSSAGAEAERQALPAHAFDQLTHQCPSTPPPSKPSPRRCGGS